MYIIPNINAYIPDATLNSSCSPLFIFIDNERASKFVVKSTNIKMNINDFIV